MAALELVMKSFQIYCSSCILTVNMKESFMLMTLYHMFHLQHSATNMQAMKSGSTRSKELAIKNARINLTQWKTQIVQIL